MLQAIYGWFVSGVEAAEPYDGVCPDHIYALIILVTYGHIARASAGVTHVMSSADIAGGNRRNGFVRPMPTAHRRRASLTFSSSLFLICLFKGTHIACSPKASASYRSLREIVAKTSVFFSVIEIKIKNVRIPRPEFYFIFV